MSRIQIPDVERSKLLEFDAANERYRVECDRARELRLKRLDDGMDERKLIETDLQRFATLRPKPNIKSLSELRQFLAVPESLIALGVDAHSFIDEAARYEKAVRMWMALARHFAPSMLEWPANLNPGEGLARMLAQVDDILRGRPDPAGPNDDKLVARSDAARRLKIDASGVTRFVKDRAELRENDQRGSRIYLERFRLAWEKKHSAAQRTDEIRQRAERRVNQDARQAERQMAGSQPKKPTR